MSDPGLVRDPGREPPIESASATAPTVCSEQASDNDGFNVRKRTTLTTSTDTGHLTLDLTAVVLLRFASSFGFDIDDNIDGGDTQPTIARRHSTIPILTTESSVDVFWEMDPSLNNDVHIVASSEADKENVEESGQEKRVPIRKISCIGIPSMQHPSIGVAVQPPTTIPTSSPNTPTICQSVTTAPNNSTLNTVRDHVLMAQSSGSDSDSAATAAAAAVGNGSSNGNNSSSRYSTVTGTSSAKFLIEQTALSNTSKQQQQQQQNWAHVPSSGATAVAMTTTASQGGHVSTAGPYVALMPASTFALKPLTGIQGRRISRRVTLGSAAQTHNVVMSSKQAHDSGVMSPPSGGPFSPTMVRSRPRLPKGLVKSHRLQEPSDGGVEDLLRSLSSTDFVRKYSRRTKTASGTCSPSSMTPRSPFTSPDVRSPPPGEAATTPSGSHLARSLTLPRMWSIKHRLEKVKEFQDKSDRINTDDNIPSGPQDGQVGNAHTVKRHSLGGVSGDTTEATRGMFNITNADTGLTGSGRIQVVKSAATPTHPQQSQVTYSNCGYNAEPACMSCSTNTASSNSTPASVYSTPSSSPRMSTVEQVSARECSPQKFMTPPMRESPARGVGDSKVKNNTNNSAENTMDNTPHPALVGRGMLTSIGHEGTPPYMDSPVLSHRAQKVSSGDSPSDSPRVKRVGVSDSASGSPRVHRVSAPGQTSPYIGKLRTTCVDSDVSSAADSLAPGQGFDSDTSSPCDRSHRLKPLSSFDEDLSLHVTEDEDSGSLSSRRRGVRENSCETEDEGLGCAEADDRYPSGSMPSSSRVTFGRGIPDVASPTSPVPRTDSGMVDLGHMTLEDDAPKRLQRLPESCTATNASTNIKMANGRFLTHPPMRIGNSTREGGSVDSNGLGSLRDSSEAVRTGDLTSPMSTTSVDSHLCSSEGAEVLSYPDVVKDVTSEMSGIDKLERKNSKTTKQKSKSDPSGQKQKENPSLAAVLNVHTQSTPLLSEERDQVSQLPEFQRGEEEKRKSKSDNVLSAKKAGQNAQPKSPGRKVKTVKDLIRNIEVKITTSEDSSEDSATSPNYAVKQVRRSSKKRQRSLNTEKWEKKLEKPTKTAILESRKSKGNRKSSSTAPSTPDTQSPEGTLDNRGGKGTEEVASLTLPLTKKSISLTRSHSSASVFLNKSEKAEQASSGSKPKESPEGKRGHKPRPNVQEYFGGGFKSSAAGSVPELSSPSPRLQDRILSYSPSLEPITANSTLSLFEGQVEGKVGWLALICFICVLFPGRTEH